MVPLRQQVRFGQLLLEDFGCLSTCWEVALRWRCEGCPLLLTLARELCLTPVVLCVRCLVMDHDMSLPLFLSISGRYSPRPAVRPMPPSRSRLSAVPDRHRTGHFVRLRSTNVRQVFFCVPCLRQERARSGHVQAAVASAHRAEMGMPRAQARGNARPDGPGPGQMKPDAARPEGGGSLEQAAPGSARP